jgi:pimeloyl-ACP methyl ester carboxylesterase
MTQFFMDRRRFLFSATWGAHAVRHKRDLPVFLQKITNLREPMPDTQNIPITSRHLIEADGVHVFYRAAGPADAPIVLLLHGFPTSSFQYRDLIPRLADRYRVIAPDLPGFGFTEVPAERKYVYTFDSLARTIFAFTEALKLTRYAIYVFDYGAPTGFRLALMTPERITAIVSQNGNAYEEGLGNAWQPIQRYWREPSIENRNAIRAGLNLEGMRQEYSVGIPDPSR